MQHLRREEGCACMQAFASITLEQHSQGCWESTLKCYPSTLKQHSQGCWGSTVM